VLEQQVSASGQQLFKGIAIGQDLRLVREASGFGFADLIAFLTEGFPSVFYAQFLYGFRGQLLDMEAVDDAMGMWKQRLTTRFILAAISRVTSLTCFLSRSGILFNTSISLSDWVPRIIATTVPLRPLAALLVTTV
jgi:hypothetical protein